MDKHIRHFVLRIYEHTSVLHKHVNNIGYNSGLQCLNTTMRQYSIYVIHMQLCSQLWTLLVLEDKHATLYMSGIIEFTIIF